MHFVREKTLLEAMASSLTELFSPAIISERMRACSPATISSRARRLRISTSARRRPKRDSDFALDYVKRHARHARDQQAVLAALEFKCGVLWAMLDALHHAYVAPGHVPPGAFVPDETMSDAYAIRPCEPELPRGVRLTKRAAWRQGAARARTRIQGRRDRGRDPEALHRQGDVRPDRRRLAAAYNAPRERIAADVGALLQWLADKRLVELAMAAEAKR